MDRRQFTKMIGGGAVGLGLSKTALASADKAPQLAITIDDFNLFGAAPAVAEQRNSTLLATLQAQGNLKAGAFVCGKYIDNALGKSLVRQWGAAGHLIANHTYSHWYYPRHTYEEYTQDILRAEALIKDLPGFTRRFRFPLLKEGNTVVQRDNLRAFLKVHGYRMGYVTIDTSDWYVDERLRARLAREPAAALMPYKEYYLNHLWERASFYDELARKVLGRSVRHTLLIHYTLLNELFLRDVLGMFQRKGWRLIDAQPAFTDEVFSAMPNILPAGESIIWALAKASGKFNDILRYPGEDSEYEKARMDKLGL